MRVDVCRFDDMDVQAVGVKIDVEGYELEVLRGMSDALKHGRPLLMIECNDNDEACKDLLRAHGYTHCFFDPKRRRFVESPPEAPRNWFAIPPHRNDAFPIERQAV